MMHQRASHLGDLRPFLHMTATCLLTEQCCPKDSPVYVGANLSSRAVQRDVAITGTGPKAQVAAAVPVFCRLIRFVLVPASPWILRSARVLLAK